MNKIKYIKVDWPESQLFENDDFIDLIYEGYPTCSSQGDGSVIFVPEDLYNKVINHEYVKN